MSEVTIMTEVLSLLTAGELTRAQERVIEIETAPRGPRLPSSVFERVLRAAVEAGALAPAYERFCSSAYGRAAYAKLLESMRRPGARPSGRWPAVRETRTLPPQRDARAEDESEIPTALIKGGRV